MHRKSDAPLLAGAVTSGIAAVLGLAQPGGATFSSTPGTALVADIAGPGAAVAVLVVGGLLGVAAGIAALAGALSPPGVVAAAGTQVLVFGVLLQSTAALSTAGYLVALAMPAVGVLLLVQLIRRYPRARWLVGLPVALGLAVAVVVLRADIAHLAGSLAPALLAAAPRLLVTILFVLTVFSWASAALGAATGTAAEMRATGWIVRHRTVFTVVAACCLLPYGIARLSWLTPWPLLGGAGIDLPTRIWGVTLGSAAWFGVVLTLGLVRPWGEVFPRWMPVVAGRPVPVAVAAVPGGIVAAVGCAAAVPWLHAAGRNVPAGASVDSAAGAARAAGDLSTALLPVLVFPCWLWGPSLALAVWGYVGHRRRAVALPERYAAGR